MTCPPDPLHSSSRSERLSCDEELEHLRRLLEHSPDILLETTLQGRILYVSPSVARILGYEPRELVGCSIFDGIHADDVPEALGQLGLPECWTTCRYRHRDGSWRWLEASGGGCVISDGTPHAVMVVRDVTRHAFSTKPLRNERGQVVSLIATSRDLGTRSQSGEAKASSDTQLRQAQKLEALGTLAGGIAHDFNNILAAIMAYTDLALMDADRASSVRCHLSQVSKACLRAKDLVCQILTFSRHQKPERKPVRLHQVVEEALKLLRSALPATIEIEPSIDPATPKVLADASQIHQVVMNLCMNGAHAMREKPGRLRVSLSSCWVDELVLKSCQGLRPGPHVRLSVTDTGRGMDNMTLKRIFEPFFTTKPQGEGTGLGLPVVDGIVKEHEGTITVESIQGAGSAFHVYLPALSSVDPAIPAPLHAARRGQGEHILLVEDESSICSATRTALENLGYRVTMQTDPDEALKLFCDSPGAFDLVITDLAMPRLTGVDLTRQILRLRPRQAVMLTSGFNGTWTPERLRELGIREFIVKPASLAELCNAVGRALNPPLAP